MDKPNYIPYGRQEIDDSDIEAVVRALKSDYLTTGPEVAAFEEAFAATVGAKYAVAVCNATAALHLALQVAGIKQGNRVVTSPNTFLSSANCAAFVGAIPDFVDIDSSTYNLCPRALEENWQDDCRAVIAVAYAGQSANMPEIARVARRKGAIVIEDGCHGTGGGFRNEGKDYLIGSHPWADITTFSFHPVKTMTTGEGGIIVTNNEAYAESARQLRSHGMVRQADQFKGFGSEGNGLSEIGPWTYEMQALGYNYRITDIQCALGLSQLKRLPAFIERRRHIVEKYNQAFAGLKWLQTPGLRNNDDRDLISWHLYTTQIDFEQINLPRAEAMRRLAAHQVGTQVLYIPVYLQPWYRESYGYAAGKCPTAEAYYAKSLSLPLFPAMTDADVEHVIETVRQLPSLK